MYHFPRNTALLLAAPFLLPSLTTAQTLVLNPIQVTASRMAQTADETLASVTVIDRERIERLQATSLGELLQSAVGTGFSSNGGPGKESSLFLRGAEADHLLLLIDGVRVGSVTSGKPALADLPVAHIERIEIVRGPRSALYGSEAIGGVVQVFTRRSSDAFTPSLSLASGSDGVRRSAVGVSGGSESVWYSLSASHDEGEGHDVYFAPPTAWSPDEPDLDGYNNDSAALRLGYRFGTAGEIELNWLRSQSENAFDGGFVNESENLQEVGGVHLTFNPHPLWQSSLHLGSNRDESDSFKDGIYKSTFNTRRTSASWQNDISLGGSHYLIIGLDELQDDVDSNYAFSITSRRNSGAFAQLQGEYGDASLQLNLREDENEQFGSATTGSLAWGYRLDAALRLSASIGTAYKAPSFNELYYPGFGNATLLSEQSQSVEFGLDGQGNQSRWSLHTYRSEVTNLIATVCDANWNCTPNNIDRARLSGIEFEFERSSGAWRYLLGLSAQNPESRSGANAGNLLARRAQGGARFELDYSSQLWGAGATLAGESRRYDDAANTRMLDAYATLDLRAHWQASRDWQLAMRVANATDKAYQTAAWYAQPGRSWLLTLRYTLAAE